MTVPGPRIVVGVDGSPSSVDALCWAAGQAELTGSSLEAVVTWRCPTQYGIEFYVETVNWAELAQTTIETAVKAASSQRSISCTQTVTEGYPAYELVRLAAGAELLVVGSRGHGGFAGLLLGSVSEYVIAHADCPVVVIRHHADPAAPAEIGP